MLRYVALGAAACLLLTSPGLLPILPFPALVPFSKDQHGPLEPLLCCVLAFWLLHELNAALNQWAENRWMLKRDSGVWQWQNELAVVTGGSSGIGAMVVRELVARGIKVVVLDVEPLADEFRNDEKRLVNFYRCDITSRDAVHEAGESIRSDHGTPSILINNAGIGNANTILEVSPARLNAIFQVNILSHWHTVQEFLPAMIARKKGHIMSTASLAAFVSLAGGVDYSCTKAGLIAFHEGLTQELKHRYNCPQILTSIVYPNWTRTRMTDAIQSRLKSIRAPVVEPKQVAGAMVKQITSRRSGQVILGPSIIASIRAFPLWLQEFVRDGMANIVTVDASTVVGRAPQ